MKMKANPENPAYSCVVNPEYKRLFNNKPGTIPPLGIRLQPHLAALDKTKQFYYIPYTDFKYNMSVYLDDILQGEWNINVTSKLFEVQPIIKRSFTPMERRRDDVVLCRASIGHAYFTNGYLLRGELRPMCCNTRLTVRHVLLSCAKYAHIRRKYFAFNSLFELFRDTPAGFLIQFLRECNLYSMF